MNLMQLYGMTPKMVDGMNIVHQLLIQKMRVILPVVCIMDNTPLFSNFPNQRSQDQQAKHWQNLMLNWRKLFLWGISQISGMAGSKCKQIG